MTISITAEAAADNEAALQRMVGWRLAAIDNTTFDPPMLIEAIGVVNIVEDEIKVIDITVWPNNGWMAGIQITVDNGLMGPNRLHFTR